MRQETQLITQGLSAEVQLAEPVFLTEPRSNNTVWLFSFAIIVLLTAVLLFPLLRNGAVGDDVYRVHLNAYAAMTHQSFGHALAAVSTQLRKEMGGWFPLQVIPLAFWMLSPPLIIARIFQILAIGINVGTLFVLVHRIAGLRSAWFASILTFAALQDRVFFDPILGPTLVMPLFVEFVLLSAIGLSMVCDFPRRGITLCLIGMVCACLMDANGYGICLAFSCITLCLLPDRAKSLALPLAVIPFLTLCAGWAIGMRGLPGNFLSEVMLPRYLHDSIFQFLSAIPTSYRSLAHVVPDVPFLMFEYDNRFVNVPALGAISYLIAFILTLIAALTFPRLRDYSKFGAVLLASLGMALWFMPSLLPAPEGTWLQGLPAGEAFPGVYVEIFGFALAATAFLTWLAKFIPGAGTRNIVMATCSVVLFFAFIGNIRAADIVILNHDPQDSAAEMIAEAGKAGAFRSVPAGATVFIDSNVPLPLVYSDGAGYRGADAAFYDATGQRFIVRPVSDFVKAAQKRNYLITILVHQSEPAVVVARITGFKGTSAYTDGGVAYVVDPDAATRDGELVLPEMNECVRIQRRPTGMRAQLMRSTRLCGDVPIIYPFTVGRVH